MTLFRKTAAALALGLSIVTGTVVLDAAVPSEAQAAGISRVCHNGPQKAQPPVYVWETGGAVYPVYPGDCTPVNINIRAVRPANGSGMSFRQESTGLGPTGKLFRKSYVTNSWWYTLGQDISVVSTHYGA